MTAKVVVAKVLLDELTSIGIQSLTSDEAERIAARILERITELELELAAREIAPHGKRD